MKSKLPYKKLKCWKEAEALLLKGASPEKVAKYIQEHGEKLDIKYESLVRRLYEIRRELSIGQVLPRSVVDKKVDELPEKVDVLKEQLWIYNEHKKRVVAELEAEKRQPLKLRPKSKQVTENLWTLMRMAKQIEKTLQELGLIKMKRSLEGVSYDSYIAELRKSTEAFKAMSKEKQDAYKGDVILEIEEGARGGPDKMLELVRKSNKMLDEKEKREREEVAKKEK